MEKFQLVITLADGQTIHAEMRPEDERRLAELIGAHATFEIERTDDDLEGHAFSGDVLVNVLNHSIALRLPSVGDAAALRRALAAGALTATIVGAGVIAALPGPADLDWTPIAQAPAHEQVLNVPAMAMRAQQAEMARDRAFELANVPLDVDNPAIPAQALRAEQAEMSREAAFAATQATAGESAQQAAQTASQSVLLDVENPQIPAQALRAEQAEMAHEQALGGSSISQAAQQSSQSAAVPSDADNSAVPDQARRAGTQ